ncbi:MAG TPA: right-handed parallel beta-helix repeat-containing protein [Polyangia bacterium]|jgi:hypothetical protein
MLSRRADAAEYYVAPTGSDSNPGTMAQPFASIQKGNDVAAAGDTVWLRAGTYYSTKQITLSRSGTSDSQRTKFWAYQQEVPVLDCSKYATTNKAADVAAILVTGNWIHLRGLEIANGPVGASGDHSISMLRTKNASNNTFELLNIHHGFGPGLFVDTGMGGNLILNCDSHDNYDKNGSQGDGQNGDGFGVHYQTTGPSTIIRGCRAWINSDDGYDLISQEVPVTVENSWAIMNGYSNGGASSPADGNGNGFKMGSSQTGIRHLVQNNVAWKNKAAGFYANHSSGGNTWLNNTSYMNGIQYNMLASAAGDSSMTIVLSGSLVHKMRNNIGFPNKNTNMSGVDTMFNTWDLNITEASSDFVSTSDTGYTGPRQADGSIPAIDFLKLKAGSPVIDKGTDVGLAFVGTAPDLGAYEYGAVTSSGTGGSGTSGSGGTVGSGGAAAGGRGGASAAGGATGSAGKTGAAGKSGSGGASASGGATSVGSGGQVGGGTGGAASGGLSGSGGAQGSGGLQGSGGNPGGTASGGSPTPDGATGAGSGGVTGGSDGGTPEQSSSAAGCACNTGPGSGDLFGAVLASLMLAFAGRRRGARARR